MSVDYLLHESPVGYAVFEVVHKPDTIGNRLKEVQDSVQVVLSFVQLEINFIEEANRHPRTSQNLAKWSS